MPHARIERQRLGALAEDAACAHLESTGLRVLARNVRYPFGEIDLVAQEQATVVFVEVRFRKSLAFGGAAGSVNVSKRRKIVRAAQAWLSANPRFSKAACRFDVVAVIPADSALHCDWLRAAFTLDDLTD